MDELERAYLLSGEELLLLFSLLDSRRSIFKRDWHRSEHFSGQQRSPERNV